jgi:formamidopyrimidine-DNA glycosylase
MPELPEVEVTRLSIAPHIVGKKVLHVRVREPRLRWPVPNQLVTELPGYHIENVTRRGKYLLLHTSGGCVILHLGMSGSVRLLPDTTAPEKHDHVDIIFDDHLCLRLRDPRRFGALLWTHSDPMQHTLLSHLGVEPLENNFDGQMLHRAAHGRTLAIKHFIMDSHIVVGVGNIYANEALFTAGIHPARAAGRIAVARYGMLVCAIKQVLRAALKKGGTTLRDFHTSDGEAGYFQQHLKVYGRDGQPCPRCKLPLRLLRQGQRASFYCPHCQR